jgi:hypothetical protein
VLVKPHLPAPILYKFLAIQIVSVNCDTSSEKCEEYPSKRHSMIDRQFPCLLVFSVVRAAVVQKIDVKG